ncbi:hypothetical protein [Campylobacter phage vB_Cj_QDYZ]|uniref:Uncharacterized protein n=1 Tax=Campylobacter phage vB_Cj_QDYZ TaxID=3032374 RepID=A0AAF0K4Z7_9CAUD|nr:hypothetical protein [Campylobacter phage vB_Cj_QDYZ]
MPPIKHMSVADRIAQKRYRKQPKIKRKLKIRAKKNAKAPSENMSWSSKKRGYVRKDPKLRRTMKLVAKLRRKS